MQIVNFVIFIHWVFVNSLILAGVLSIVLEIKNSKNGEWFIERVDILEISVIHEFKSKNGLDITFLDILFDLYYILATKNVFKFYSILLTLYFLNWLTWVYFILFIWNNLKISSTIVKYLILNKTKEIQFKVKDFSPSDHILKLLIMNILNLKMWNFLLFYNIIGFKTRKVNIYYFEKFLITLILGFPSWYIKLIFEIVLWAEEVIKDEVWKRKLWRAWPGTLLEKIKFKLFETALKNLIKDFALVKDLKIIIINRSIRLNPVELPTILNFIKNNPEIFNSKEFINIECATFYGRSHQYFKSNTKNCGYVMTSGNFVWIGKENKEKIETQLISHYYKHQKMVFSHIEESNIKKGVSEGFWQAMGFYDYRRYAGFILRLRIIYSLDITERLIFQNNEGGHIEKLNQVIYTKWAYHYYFNYSKNPGLEKFYSLQTIHSVEKDLKEWKDLKKAIIFELNLIPNEDLFDFIVKNYKRNLMLTLFEKELKSSHQQAMVAESFL